jgi:hypothetical protein
MLARQFVRSSSALLAAGAIWVTTMSAEAGLVRGVGGAVSEHGTLFTSETDPMTGAGDTIYDFELKKMVETHIGTAAGVNYESMVFAFTQCYSGYFADSFSSFGNTAILSATDSLSPSANNGYHRGVAENLKPGKTTDFAHQKGVDNKIADATGTGFGDRPSKSGPNLTVGGSLSTHVLYFGGVPSKYDQADIDNINANFNGHIGTTVTVLAGDGTGTGVDGPATRDRLAKALKSIGNMMNPNEQFIFYAGDHGNNDAIEVRAADTTPGPQTESLDAPALPNMLDDPNNVPQLTFFSQQQVTPSAIQNLTFNGLPLNWADFTQYMLDYDDDGFDPSAGIDLFKYSTPIPEPLIMPTGNIVSFFFTGAGFSTPWALEGISLESGGIARLDAAVPEPSTMLTFLVAGLATVIFAARLRARPKR